MSNFSSVISDSQILEIVKTKEARRVLILGCNGCMNESLALTRKKPLMNYKKEVPYEPIFSECDRICNLLDKNGITSSFEVLGRENNALCIRDNNQDDYSLSEENLPDLVMIMSCPAGIWSMKECLSGVAVVGSTEYKGVFSFSYIDDTEKKEIKDFEIIYRK